MPTLNWAGKDKVVNHHLEVPFHFLERRYSFDVNGRHDEDNGAENCIIHGDNLLALKALLPQYAGRVKCIYIDPPYNTGNEGWVYNDNVNDPQIKKWLGQVVGPEGMDFSRHDKWLCMMYPRLRLLQKLLADDGAIFISIDDNELYNLKAICDEIFGANNFVADVSVVNNWKGRSDDKYIATAHESLLIYRKSDFITNGVLLPDEYDREYKLSDALGRYRLQGLRKRGSNSRREDRPNLFYPFYYDEANGVLSLEKLPDSVEILPHLSDGSDGNWRWGKETANERIDELVAQKVSRRNEYDVFQKDYLPNDGVKRIKPKSVWMGAEFAKETGTLEVKAILGKGKFDTPKPLGLLEYILQQATDKDSIVLDSFGGSGTTAHAVLKLNQADGGHRKFICIEMMDYAETVTAERVKRVVQGYGGGKNAVAGTGGAFSYYELGPSLLVENKLNPELPPERLREYIWQAEVRQTAFPHRHALPPTRQDNEPYLLGVEDETAYYLIPSGRLDKGALQQIQTKAKNYVVYAELCTLDEAFLAHWHIVFKKIPRDLPQP